MPSDSTYRLACRTQTRDTELSRREFVSLCLRADRAWRACSALGRKVREHRVNAMLSVQAMAERAGVPAATVRSIEAGAVPPTRACFERVVRVLLGRKRGGK